VHPLPLFLLHAAFLPTSCIAGEWTSQFSTLMTLISENEDEMQNDNGNDMEWGY
jgi:hypothetical protein